MTYYAHSKGAEGSPEPVGKHVLEVSRLAGEFAGAWRGSEEAEFAGLLHDLGKYGERFQLRLRGLDRGVDHWSAGAWECLDRGKALGAAAALCVQGHHIGLQSAEKDKLRGLAAAQADGKTYLERFGADGLTANPPTESVMDWALLHAEPAAQMLGVRMLFSALTDADYLCTERHFDGEGAFERRRGVPTLDPATCLSCLESLEQHVRDLEAESDAPEPIKEIRRGLRRDCEQAARQPQGLFTLTAPTGTGKTLAMLAFALRHALEHRLRRVVVVIPYLTIVEQTVQEYRKALGRVFSGGLLDSAILEHHSLAGTRGKGEQDEPGQEEAARRRKILTENWNAPFVVTTSVQFLESLFANRPGACRKLHSLANSVVLMDEVQTIPTRLAIPTLATISGMTAQFGATVVLATATQPAFDHLEPEVKKLCRAGWKPKELVGDKVRLYGATIRTRVEWPERGQRTAWDELAALLRKERRALCVVNVKKHAVRLFDALGGEEGVFHLSTSMCPAHRNRVLEEVRRRLATDAEDCLLVSTQCVEAGVDLDFPAVFRAMGPLESIAQAAGRCNRHGKMQVGVVRVFRPETDGKDEYPNKAYEQAADLTEEMLLKQKGAGGVNIHEPATFDAYYRRLYILGRPEDQHRELRDALEAKDFERVAKEYRIIDKAALNVVVPYEPEEFEDLATEIRNGRLTREWIARARPYTVGVYRPRADAPLWSWLEPVKVTWDKTAEDWYLLGDAALYDRRTGLRPPEGLAWMEV